MNITSRKQLQLRRTLIFFCTLFQFTSSALLYQNLTEDNGETTKVYTGQTTGINTADQPDDFKASNVTQSPSLPDTNHRIRCTSEAPEDVTTTAPASSDHVPHVQNKFPSDLFSIEDRTRGWLILHIFGMMYMFISIVIVCNEFFVPALGVITEKLAISDDVAGATFLAAGGSAPKLFGSLIGVLMSEGVPGYGIMVGSVVFNILFVIGMCALLSREELHLTWWPLFRDVSFYILNLILLIFFLLDRAIMWWESMMLLTSYIFYMIFVKFNLQIEQVFKSHLHKSKNIIKVGAVENPEKECLPTKEGSQDGEDEDDSDKDNNHSSKNNCDDLRYEEEEEQEKKKDKPLSLKWPDTPFKQATYLFLLPIIFPLWLTIPDVRRKKSRKLFVVTFLISVLWIVVFSYFMAWWNHQVGETVGINDLILTVLAAEMPMTDLILSVIVARKGLGDMAMSGSMGRNIFSITVCLGGPWLLSSSIHSFSPVIQCNSGLYCAVTLLLLSIIAAITSISSCKWKTNKVLGLTLLMLFFIFLVIRLMFTFRVIVCPL